MSKRPQADASDIVATLCLRHPEDKAALIAECKTGSSWSGYPLRLDAWVLLKTWSPMTAIGYEVKVSRSDFLNDRKWQGYLPYCHEFYFVSPSGLIAPEEMSDGAGLLWCHGTRLVTKRKAARREIDPVRVVQLMAYVLMSRARIVSDMNEAAQSDDTKRQWWRSFVEGRVQDLELGHQASVKVAAAMRRLEYEQRAAQRRYESLKHVEDRLHELGLDPERQASTYYVDEKLLGDRKRMAERLRSCARMGENLKRMTEGLNLEGVA